MIAKAKRKRKPKKPLDRRHIIDRLGPAHPLVARYLELGREWHQIQLAIQRIEYNLQPLGEYGGYTADELKEMQAEGLAERRKILAKLYRMDKEQEQTP